jgi:heptosyltransferase III
MRRLLIRGGGIGDCILALPALEYFKSDYTEVWVPTAVVPLVQFADRVRPLASTGIDLFGVGDLTPSSKLVETLAAFDSIVSWYGAQRSEFRSALGKMGLRYEFYRAIPPGDYDGHAADFFSLDVGAPAGVDPRIHVEPAAQRESIVIHPFSGSPRKNWPLERFRELAARLSCKVEWTAGPEEELAEATRFENLAELGAWIRGARLYIGNDSGITHLAAAAGAATVALFGCAASARRWGPRGDNVTIVVSGGLERLEVERVRDAVNQRLGSPTP